MDRELPTIHPEREHVPERDGLRVLPGRQALRLAIPPTEMVGSFGWHTAKETLDIYIEKFGIPYGIPDISVDDLTSRRLDNSDYAGVVELRLTDVRTHPSFIEQAMKFLSGRRPEVRWESDDAIVISFNAEDDSLETKIAASHFGYSLAYLAGAIPRVWVNRYRNFPADDSQTDDR